MEFNALPFHDSVLREIKIDFGSGVCEISITPIQFEQWLGKSIQLVWSDLTKFSVTHEFPWGESVHINNFRQLDKNNFELEIQSGDLIMITASKNAFRIV